MRSLPELGGVLRNARRARGWAAFSSIAQRECHHLRVITLHVLGQVPGGREQEYPTCAAPG